jgi:hypothetical protein
LTRRCAGPVQTLSKITANHCESLRIAQWQREHCVNERNEAITIKRNR